MSRTHRHADAFRKGRRIISPVHSACWLRFQANGKPFCVDGSEAWGTRHRRWAKRQASRLRRRHFTREDRMRKQDALEMFSEADIVTERVQAAVEEITGLDITEDEAGDLINWFAQQLADEREDTE